MGEHYVDIVGVASSILAVPTIPNRADSANHTESRKQRHSTKNENTGRTKHYFLPKSVQIVCSVFLVCSCVPAQESTSESQSKTVLYKSVRDMADDKLIHMCLFAHDTGWPDGVDYYCGELTNRIGEFEIKEEDGIFYVIVE